MRPLTQCCPLLDERTHRSLVTRFLFSQVSLLEYRKRQREARRSGSKTECSSPVSTVPPLTVDAFPVGLETPSDPPAPTPPCNTTVVKEAPTCEEADVQGERGEKEEGQWCVSESLRFKTEDHLLVLASSC